MTIQSVSMSAYLLKGTETKRKWKKFFFSFSKEGLLGFSEEMAGLSPTEQGQQDECFYRTSKTIQMVESKLEMRSTSDILL